MPVWEWRICPCYFEWWGGQRRVKYQWIIIWRKFWSWLYRVCYDGITQDYFFSDWGKRQWKKRVWGIGLIAWGVSWF